MESRKLVERTYLQGRNADVDVDSRHVNTAAEGQQGGSRGAAGGTGVRQMCRAELTDAHCLSR